MRKVLIALAVVLVVAGAAALAAAVFLAEVALHMPNRAAPNPAAAARLALDTNGSWEPAHILAADGVPLEGWLFRPPAASTSAVILLHGVGDTRTGMLAHARYLLDAGFVVLAPDVRGHGASGGDITTYGIRESADVHGWAEWLFRERSIQNLYGMGESMGAAILLQSLEREPRLRAVVAECPFATFAEVANYRVSRASPLGQPFNSALVQLGFSYARVRYGVDLRQASPRAAVRATHTPILLIHGVSDVNIPPFHSRELHAANPVATQLWEVPGAVHVSALSQQPSQFRRAVVGWFRSR